MRSQTVSTKLHQLAEQSLWFASRVNSHMSVFYTLITEEPYDRIGHVRICGGRGW